MNQAKENRESRGGRDSEKSRERYVRWENVSKEKRNIE